MDFSERYNELSKSSNNLDNLLLHDLELFLHDAKDIQMEYKNLQLVVKADANSLYGVSASQYFSLQDVDIAEDICGTGKHFAVSVDHSINKFFVNWGDEELRIIQKFYPDVLRLRKFTEYVPDTRNDICVYGDTDSRYCDTEMIYNLLITENGPMKLPESDKELSDFVIFMMDNFLNSVIKKTIDDDCIYRNARIGHLKMNHEVTTRKCVFQKKKKYIMTCICEDGKLLNKPKLKFKGVELKKGSMSPKAKKILGKLMDKYLLDGYDTSKLRTECIKLITYIKQRKDKDFIYQISTVSGLKNITKSDANIYSSDKNHIQMQIALSWYNFIEKNKLTKEYRKPFEGQKMKYYYCSENSEYKVMGIPDDVEINNIPGLPEPDWNKQINNVLLRPLLRYTFDKDTILDEDIINFLLGAKIWKF